jgi:hypothetical protein
MADASWAAIESAPTAASMHHSARSDPASTGQPRSRRLRRQDRVAIGAFDAAAHVFQRRARSLVLGSAAILLPTIALNLVLSIIAFDRYSSFDDVTASPATVLFGIDAASGVESLLGYLSIVTSSLSAALVGGYATALLIQQEFGTAASPMSPLRTTVRQLPRLVGAWLLGHAWVLPLGLIAVNVSSSTLGALLIPASVALVFLVTFTVVVSPTIITEDLRPVAGVRRAVRLARSRFSSSFGFVVITVIVGGGLRAGITALPRLAESTGLVGFGSYGWLVEGVAGQIAVLLVVPLVALASAQLYLQLRADAEGMDIVMAADEAFRAGGR